MNELAIKLHEAAMVLENDGEFYRKYTTEGMKLRAAASTRRDSIHVALNRNKIDQKAMLGVTTLHGTDLREHLRRYLDDVWGMPPPRDVSTCAVVLRWKELKFWEDSVKYPPQSAQAETPVPAPQAEAPPAGNGKPVLLPDDIELETFNGEEWHVTRIPDGDIMYSMTTAIKVWAAFRKLSGMEYRRPARDWSPLTSPAFTGSNPYRWKPEFTFKLLEQEASEAKVQETPKPTSSGDDPWSYSPECFGSYDNRGAFAAEKRGDKVQRWSPVSKNWVDITVTQFPPDQRYRWMPATKYSELMDALQEWKAGVRRITGEVGSLTKEDLFGGLQHNNIWFDEATHFRDSAFVAKCRLQSHAQDSLVYIHNLLDTQAKETTMNNFVNTTKPAAIVITTKTMVNGVDIATVSDSDIYDLIAKQEAAVADLEKIDNKPKKLVNEIAKRKAGIQALVDYLDSKEPADDAGSTAPAAE